jgi:lipopolysaccharide exporter
VSDAPPKGQVAPNSVLKGALFAVSGRWIGRLIGMASTVVLARLLLPEDFGVVAMAFIVLGLASTFLDIGVNVALVRNAHASDVHFHSAWTLRLIQTALVAAILLVVAPFAGDYFRDARVGPVIMLLALNVVLGSLENIGIVSFQKQQRFDREFRYMFVNRVFAFVCTVSLAFWLRNYWALVLAGTAGTVFTVVHSYVAHSMRPRLSFERVREILVVSQWMLVQNVGLYLDTSLHKIFVGRRDDTSVMGAYSLAAELAALPSTELLQPLNRVLFPAFVAVRHDLAQLKKAFLLAQGVQVMVALPAAIFLALLAPDLVPVLLGDKWGSAVPLLQTLAIGSALGAIQISAWYVSVTLGRERQSAYLTWAQVVLVALLVLVILPQARAREIAEIRAAVPAVALILQIWIVKRALGNLQLREVVAGLWRTALAVALASAAILLLPPFGGHAVNLAGKTLVCLVLYPTALLSAWNLCGAPEGAERYIVLRLASAWQAACRAARARE